MLVCYIQNYSNEFCVQFFFFDVSLNLAPEMNVLRGISMSIASNFMNFFICFTASANFTHQNK